MIIKQNFNYNRQIVKYVCFLQKGVLKPFLENAATSKYKKTNKYKATNINTEGAKHAKEPNSINLTKLTAEVIVP